MPRFAERIRRTDCLEEEDISHLNDLLLYSSGTNATAILDGMAQILHDLSNNPECDDSMACRHKLKSQLLDTIIKKMSVIEHDL